METTISTQSTRARWINWTNLLVVAIVLFAAFLRLYRVEDYMTFLGDEGRDVLVVKHLLEGDLVGLGPTASVGGFFTGPIYYYLMAPFLWLFHLDPVGPAVMVALFGVATVFLVYVVGKEFVDYKAGFIAASLYAASPLVLGYSRSSWNPNLLPFFSLLIVYVLYKAVVKDSLRLFLVVGFLFGIALQLHYIATFLGTIVVLYVFVVRLYFGQGKSILEKAKLLGKTYLTIFFGFLIGFSPFLAFEATHGFQNIRTVITFIFGATGETGFVGEKFSSIIANLFFRLFGRLLMRFPPPEQITIGIDTLQVDSYGFLLKIPIGFLYIGTIILAVASVGLLLAKTIGVFKKNNTGFLRYSLFLLWLFFGIFLFGFYKKPIYDYYFGFMFPLPFLLTGMVFSNMWDRFGLIGKNAMGIAFLFLLLLNFDGRPMKYEPNRQLEQVKKISTFVLEKAEGKPFNFALITNQNSDHGYRYFFELEGNPSVTIINPEADPERKSITDQLLIVCESNPCHPLGDPLHEVAGFGRAEIVGGPWDVIVVKVYKLVHYTGEE